MIGNVALGHDFNVPLIFKRTALFSHFYLTCVP